MTLSTDLRMAMLIGSGIAWTLVYVLIIKHGFEDKTFGMPLWALAANLSWEFIFAFVLPVHETTQRSADIVWWAFDMVIAYQFLRFGRTSVRGTPLERYFYPMFVIVIAVCFTAVLTITLQFEPIVPPRIIDGRYAAFAQNLMMSILFVAMLNSRDDLSGQSIYIGIFKLIGTLLPSIFFLVVARDDLFLMFTSVTIFAFDLLYVMLFWKQARALKVNPWRL